MGSIHIQMFPKAFAAGAPPQTPPIAKESAFRPLQNLTRRDRVENIFFFYYSLRNILRLQRTINAKKKTQQMVL